MPDSCMMAWHNLRSLAERADRGALGKRNDGNAVMETVPGTSGGLQRSFVRPRGYLRVLNDRIRRAYPLAR